MFNRVKAKLNDIKEQYTFQKEERVRIAKERTAEEKRIEMARIQAEKDALMALSEKELLVEIMLELRGYNTLLTNVEEQQKEMEYMLNSLKSDFYSLDSAVNELRNK